MKASSAPDQTNGLMPPSPMDLARTAPSASFSATVAVALPKLLHMSNMKPMFEAYEDTFNTRDSRATCRNKMQSKFGQQCKLLARVPFEQGTRSFDAETLAEQRHCVLAACRLPAPIAPNPSHATVTCQPCIRGKMPLVIHTPSNEKNPSCSRRFAHCCLRSSSEASTSPARRKPF